MSTKKGNLLIGLALSAITLAVYGSVVTFDFVSYDDLFYVAHNPHVTEGLTAESIQWAFSEFYLGNSHPLTWLSLMADAEWSGVNAGTFHRTNLVLHLANVLLVFAVFQLLTGTREPSAFVAAMFAVHPVHVESVAWVSERKDVLSVFFGLIALWCYGQYARGKGKGWYAALVVAFVLSLMSKQMLVTLPCVLMLLDYWPLRRRAFREKIPLFVLSAIFSVTCWLAQSSGQAVQSFQQFPFDERLRNVTASYVMYLFKTVWPENLAVFYPYTSLQWSVTFVLCGGLMLIAISSFVVWKAKTRPALFVGWFWFLGTLVPVIGLVQVGEQAYADRYLYFPQLGLSLMLGWGMPWTAIRGFGRAASRAAACAAVAIWSVLSWTQVGYWKNSQTLFQHALEVTDKNYLAMYSLGQEFHNQRQLDDAITCYRMAIDFAPWCVTPHNNLGIALATQGKLDEAIQEYEIALKMRPDDGGMRGNLANALVRQGNLAAAIEQYQQAIAKLPNNPELPLNLAAAYATQGRFDLAAPAARTALELALHSGNKQLAAECRQRVQQYESRLTPRD